MHLGEKRVQAVNFLFLLHKGVELQSPNPTLLHQLSVQKADCAMLTHIGNALDAKMPAIWVCEMDLSQE